MLKKEVRVLNRSLRDAMDGQSVERLSELIAKRVLESEIYKQSDILLTYLSFRNEPDAGDIIRHAFRDGKRVAAPAVSGDSMEFYFIHEGEEMRCGAYGISEPLNTSEFNRFAGADFGSGILMLVPGLGFDKKGNRVGYGAGYYDRYLSAHSDIPIHTCGLCYDFMLMDKIEAEDFDFSVENVITPAKTIHITKQA